MVGGNGSDIYYVDHAGDVVIETNATASTGGTDSVYSSLGSYTLGANVENGRIMATGAANLIGNGLNNVLYAGAGNNVLHGGAGSDTVDYSYATSAVKVNLGVTIAQATAGSGSDRLIAIERLTGSKYNDILSGSTGNNKINGGAGNDILSGAAGLDIFRFSNALSATANVDTIKDFASVYDSIELENAVFTKLSVVGTLAAANFRANTTGRATDGNDYVVYETDTGRLFYDADGSGAGVSVMIATLTGAPTLTHADIFVT
jgi:Ca2+-binding RTX toxin-like protein